LCSDEAPKLYRSDLETEMNQKDVGKIGVKNEQPHKRDGLASLGGGFASQGGRGPYRAEEDLREEEERKLPQPTVCVRLVVTYKILVMILIKLVILFLARKS
jgi:hypothetical protein